jgi:hypothetical protein
MASPLVAQGTLNRLRGSIVCNNNANLNVTPSFLTKEGIRLSFSGETVTYIPTMTGAVTSSEIYLIAEITAHLNKAQALANIYKQTMENNSLIGDVTVRSDSAALGIYNIANASIGAVRELDFSGDSAQFVIVIKGYYLVNSVLFD